MKASHSGVSRLISFRSVGLFARSYFMIRGLRLRVLFWLISTVCYYYSLVESYPRRRPLVPRPLVATGICDCFYTWKTGSEI